MNLESTSNIYKKDFIKEINKNIYNCIYEIFYDFFYAIGYRIKFYRNNVLCSVLFMSKNKFIASHTCQMGTVTENNGNEDDFLYDLDVMTNNNHHVSEEQKDITRWIQTKEYKKIFDKEEAKCLIIKKCGA